MAFWRNKAYIGIHGSPGSGMLCNRACYTGRICYRHCWQEGMFLTKARYYIITVPLPLPPPLPFLLSLIGGDIWKHVQRNAPAPGDRIHSLLWTVQSASFCLSVQFKGTWVSWQNSWINTLLYCFLRDIDFQYTESLLYCIYLLVCTTLLNCAASKTPVWHYI